MTGAKKINPGIKSVRIETKIIIRNIISYVKNMYAQDLIQNYFHLPRFIEFSLKVLGLFFVSFLLLLLYKLYKKSCLLL